MNHSNIILGEENDDKNIERKSQIFSSIKLGLIAFPRINKKILELG